MRGFERDLETAKRAEARPRRLFERSQSHRIMCDLGPVFDLSQGGACVQAKKPFTGLKVIRFCAGDESFEVNAAIVWSSKMGFRKWVLGLQFIDVSPKLGHEIEEFRIGDTEVPRAAA